MHESPDTPPPVCKVPDCGRKICSVGLGLCQTHYRHMRRTGKVRPIQKRRPCRPGMVRLGPLSITADCAEKLTGYARIRGVALNATVTDIIEAWAERFRARRLLPHDPDE